MTIELMKIFSIEVNRINKTKFCVKKGIYKS